MDNPSSGSPRSTVLSPEACEAEGGTQTAHKTGLATRRDTMLIASFGNAVAVDYAAFVCQNSRGDALLVGDDRICGLVEAPVRLLPLNVLLRSTPDRPSELCEVGSLILFTGSRLKARERREVDAILECAQRCQAGFVGIISTFRLHLGDPHVSEVENYVLARARDLPARVVIFRPGHVLSQHSSIKTSSASGWRP